MDDTGASMDVSKATGTRKRRSSILKSQRPPRKPFSELEFNVATPTDTAKSRRVSFSRRTGVAEFAKNEGTTTWENFYEEQNKALEYSGNEIAANPHQVIEQIGRRIFDQQFEEVEVIDIGGALQTNSNNQTSFCNANVSHEPNTNEILTRKMQNFELSSMTEHQTKIFGDELSVPVMSEMSNAININFSNLNQLGDNCDDLEEIERDLERSLQKNVVCPGPFMGRDMSEYIEIDLNMTFVRPKSDDCDMSITETIQSPNVQTVPKTKSITDKKDDWIVDKENIVVNPYVTPKEHKNFALNDADDQILVFNGKRLTVQSGSEPLPDLDEKDNYRSLLPNGKSTTPQRKTIFLNINDDLPNFVLGTSTDSKQNNKQTTNETEKPKRKTIVFDEGADISITQRIPSQVMINKENKDNLGNTKRKTIVFHEGADISITQGIPSQVMINKENKDNLGNTKRKTIVFDEGADISITQGIPSKVLINKENKDNLGNNKRKTIVFDEGADISITQAIPSQVLINKENKDNLGNNKRKTIVFDEGADISITQAIPSQVLINKENKDNLGNTKRKTIVFDKGADISITQGIPSQVLINKENKDNLGYTKRKTIVFDEGADISITQGIPYQVLINKENKDNPGNTKRKTIIFDEGADISITQGIPSQVLINKENKDNLGNTKRKTIVFDEGADISITQAIPSQVLINKENKDNLGNTKRKTIVFDEGADISITQGIPYQVLINKENKDNLLNTKRKTIVFDEGADISITQAIPSQVFINKENKDNLGNTKRKTIVFDEGADISITQGIPYQVLINKENKDNLGNTKRKTIVFDEGADISITQGIPSQVLINKENKDNLGNTKRKTIVFDEGADISITQGIPSQVMINKEIKDTLGNTKRKTIVFDEGADISITQGFPYQVLINKENKDNLGNTKRKTIIFDEGADISITQGIPSQDLIDIKMNNATDNDNNLSITQAVIKNINNQKRKIIVFEEDADISITQATPVNIIKNNKIDNDNISIIQAIPSNTITNDKTSHRINDTLSYDNIVFNENDKRRSIFHDNVTITRATPNVFLEIKQDVDNTMRRTVYDNDISMAEAIPSNILHTNENMDVSVDDASVPNLPKHVIVDAEENSVYSLVKNKVDDLDITAKSTRESSQNSKIQRSSISKPIPSNISNIQGDILKKNNKSVIEESRLIENNHDVLVYQANEAIMLAPLKKIEEDEEQVSESNSVINITNPSDKTKIYGICGIPMIDDNEKGIEYVPVYKEETSAPEQKPVTSESFTINRTDANENIKKSLLNELLDMSCSSIDDVMAEPKISFKLPDDGEIQTKESYEVVDNMERVENEESIENKLLNVTSEPMTIATSKLPALDYREDSKDVHHLPDQIDNLKVAVEEQITNRHYEKILSSDLQQSLEQNTDKETNVCRNVKKSFKNADDTNELLEMLSDFTEGRTDDEKEECKSHTEMKAEPKRLSFAPNRQSIVLSREDLLNNISMARAVLQQSRFEIDESYSMEDTEDFPDETTPENKKSPKKSVRMSTEVVKTLQFDEEESISETSVVSEIKASPLKKTAFGEVSYMRESKAKVIPTYLKDVSDNIKALMTDLVKPVTDGLPFESSGMDKSLRRSTSTCSTQIQANLLTSSQIDINDELLHSNTGSLHSLKPSETMVKEISSMGNKAITQALRNSVKPVNRSVSFEERIDEMPEVKSPRKPLGPVIVFDHTNPLNNILLSKPDNLEVHRYNPITSSDTNHENTTQAVNIGQCEVERVSACYNLEAKNPPSLQSGDTGGDVNKINSIVSNISKPVSIDRSIEGFALQVKDTEVNTVIAMKETKDILEANSSLTLVDDAFGQSAFDILESSDIEPAEKQTSPVKVIYKMDDEELLEKLDSDFISADDSVDDVKRKKRTYSPTKRNKAATNVDITPTPVSKMQKMSNSPNPMDKTKRSPKNKSSPEKKRRTKVIPKLDLVQQLIASSNIQDALKQEIIDAISHSSSTTLDKDVISKTLVRENSPDTVSYTSSKCATEIQDGSSDFQSVSIVGSHMSKINWQPDLVNDLSSKNMFEECSSGDNIVAKINTLPFIGTRDCEWESSTSDVWMFRLLRSRIRLIIRLAHTHHNATRSRVRADTPIVSLNVDSLLEEESDPLASLVIGLSRDAVRAACSRCVSARDVPQLLRYSAGVAKIAPKWARAMRDARARLAYRLGPGGELAFKVANIQLRSVWEVRMRIKLVVDDNMDSWPCASDVQVHPVLADADALPNVARLTQTLKQDWGHAPAAIWKIFKHLKNKRRVDDLLGL